MEALPPETAVIPAAPPASALEAILQEMHDAAPTLATLPVTAAAAAPGAIQELAAPPAVLPAVGAPAAAVAPEAGVVAAAPAAAAGLPFIPLAGVAPPASGVEALLLPAAATVPAAPGAVSPAPQLSLSTLANLPAFPQLLPQGLSMPHDLVCEGTAWPASVTPVPLVPGLSGLPAGRPIG